MLRGATTATARDGARGGARGGGGAQRCERCGGAQIGGVRAERAREGGDARGGAGEDGARARERGARGAESERGGARLGELARRCSALSLVRVLARARALVATSGRVVARRGLLGATPRLARVVVSPSRGVMGGHGGLNILPHKSWNVYGAKQRARVERDEALAREIAEEELRERENDARSARWKALGVREAEERAISGRASTVGGEHVNLFAREEMAAKHGGGRDAKRDARERDAEQSGTRFGGRTNASAPWYARTIGDEEEVNPRSTLPSRVRAEREDDEALRRLTSGRASKRAREADAKDERERRREKKRRSEKGVKSSKRESSKSEMERLRRERLEREKKETERERELLNAHGAVDAGRRRTAL